MLRYTVTFERRGSAGVSLPWVAQLNRVRCGSLGRTRLAPLRSQFGQLRPGFPDQKEDAMTGERGQVLASFHVVHFRRPEIAPPRKLVGKIDGLRYWGALNVGGNFHELRDSANPR